MDDLEVPRLNKLSLSKRKLNKLVIILIITTITALSGCSYLLYKYQIEGTKYDLLHHTKQDLQNQTNDQTKKVIAEVGKLIKLPTDEDPTLATVSDANKLKDQPFFQNSKNGDQVLIYAKAKRAILYDPVAKQIVDVANLNADQSTPPTQQARIVIRNGTPISGLASKVESVVKKNFPDANITAKDNASNSNYEKSIVISLTDSAKQPAVNLAKALNMPTSDLPVNETKPNDADILIIIGKNSQ